MESFFIDIKRQLEPYKNKVFFHGLTEPEVLDIEQNLDKPFPKYFREFLKHFGVRQDFVYGLLRREIDFIQRSEFLPDEIKKTYVLIGDNSGEDFWLLNTDDETDTNIYEWEHWSDGDIVSLGYDFETLLKDNVSKLSDTETERKTNDKKSWSVQFAIPTDNEQKIYSTIPLTLIQDWELKEISPAQVHCYETKAKLLDKVVKFTRQEYAGWTSPIYYFNLREPANEFGKRSLIKDIDDKLNKAFPDYKLIDYGIMPLTEEDE